MTINTKFDVGEFAYIVHKNKIKNVVVKSIWIEIKREATIMYSVKVFYDSNQKVNERNLFKTKKEAVQKIVKQLGYKISKNDLKGL